jgi:UDP:flavonoid glycosyltransferase YjiC (YdhE family)
MRILWAVSSVGKGHIMRDLAIAEKLTRMADVSVDWLVPDPGGEFMRSRGCNVLDHSGYLSGSGKAYAQVFSDNAREFDLLRYTKADTRLHRHDFSVSRKAWEDTSYDVIVGDEAFWLLTGFSSGWARKPAPFVFLTDFIGVKQMRPGMRNRFFAWYNNLKFSLSFLGPDVYLYIGEAEEIPDESMGFLLPGRRSWARRHCRFVRPIVNFDPAAASEKTAIRRKLGLPEDKTLFLATTGPEGDSLKRTTEMEAVFDFLRIDYPDAFFIMVTPHKGRKDWIQYHEFLDGLHRYFAAADFVLTQSGYGKIAELSALGTPFIAIPLDFHFEQEYVMAHRLNHSGAGRLVTMRNHSPREISDMVLRSMGRDNKKVAADNGAEVAGIICDNGTLMR